MPPVRVRVLVRVRVVEGGGTFSSGTIAFVCSLCHLKLKEIKSAFLNK